MNLYEEINQYIERVQMGYKVDPIDLFTLERWRSDLEKTQLEQDEVLRQQYENGYQEGYKHGLEAKPELTLEDVSEAIELLRKLTPLNRTKALIKVMETYP